MSDNTNTSSVSSTATSNASSQSGASSQVKVIENCLNELTSMIDARKSALKQLSAVNNTDTKQDRESYSYYSSGFSTNTDDVDAINADAFTNLSPIAVERSSSQTKVINDCINDLTGMIEARKVALKQLCAVHNTYRATPMKSTTGTDLSALLNGEREEKSPQVSVSNASVSNIYSSPARSVAYGRSFDAEASPLPALGEGDRETDGLGHASLNISLPDQSYFNVDDDADDDKKIATLESKLSRANMSNMLLKSELRQLNEEMQKLFREKDQQIRVAQSAKKNVETQNLQLNAELRATQEEVTKLRFELSESLMRIKTLEEGLANPTTSGEEC